MKRYPVRIMLSSVLILAAFCICGCGGREEDTGVADMRPETEAAENKETLLGEPTEPIKPDPVEIEILPPAERISLFPGMERLNLTDRQYAQTKAWLAKNSGQGSPAEFADFLMSILNRKQRAVLKEMMH